jgi:hypothetical protein
LLANELELLQRRREAMASEAGDAPGWLISDFWVEDSTAFSEALGLPNVQQQTFAAELARAVTSVVRPKLLVLIDRPDAGTPGESTIGSRLRSLASRPGVGPLLRIESSAPLTPLQQTLAAVQAMQ